MTILRDSAQHLYGWVKSTDLLDFVTAHYTLEPKDQHYKAKRRMLPTKKYGITESYDTDIRVLAETLLQNVRTLSSVEKLLSAEIAQVKHSDFRSMRLRENTPNSSQVPVRVLTKDGYEGLRCIEREIVPCKYGRIDTFFKHKKQYYAIVSCPETARRGVIDEHGTIHIPFEYQSIEHTITKTNEILFTTRRLSKVDDKHLRHESIYLDFEKLAEKSIDDTQRIMHYAGKITDPEVQIIAFKKPFLCIESLSSPIIYEPHSGAIWSVKDRTKIGYLQNADLNGINDQLYVFSEKTQRHQVLEIYWAEVDNKLLAVIQNADETFTLYCDSKSLGQVALPAVLREMLEVGSSSNATGLSMLYQLHSPTTTSSRKTTRL